jgi:hypothetical protein
MEPSENPYASPTADLTGPRSMNPELNEAETIRKKYLSHEASVQSVGFLYWLASIAMLVGSAAMIFGLLTRNNNFRIEQFIGLLYPLFAILFVWIGSGFRKLDSRVRIPAGILSVLGLISFPCGTLINAYILYLIFCPKGKMVISPEYKEIIRQTPYIKYRTSLIAWIVLIILFALIAFGIVGFYLIGRGRL